MAELALQQTPARYNPGYSLCADAARAPHIPYLARDISILPFVLAAIGLFAFSLATAIRSQDLGEKTLLFAAFGAAGMPIVHWAPAACHSRSGGASSIRLDRAELMALLAGDRT